MDLLSLRFDRMRGNPSAVIRLPFTVYRSSHPMSSVTTHARSTVHGPRTTDNGPRSTVHGSRSTESSEMSHKSQASLFPLPPSLFPISTRLLAQWPQKERKKKPRSRLPAVLRLPQKKRSAKPAPLKSQFSNLNSILFPALIPASLQHLCA